MTNTFPATLTNGVFTWGVNGAPPLPADVTAEVQVVVHTPPPVRDENAKKRLGELLEQLALRNPFRDIDDPVEYIRELRKDRPLPGREE